MAKSPTPPLTWAALLAQWMTFAKRAASLPTSGEAGLLRESVADVIALQALWCALGEWDSLPHVEQSLALDRAAVLIAKHTRAITTRYGDAPRPAALSELLDDVQARHEACQKNFDDGAA